MTNKREIKKAVSLANKSLCVFPTYHESIPVGALVSVVEEAGLTATPEDYMGIYCGNEGKTTIELTYQGEVIDHLLCLSWYRMTTGRVEIVAYVS